MPVTKRRARTRQRLLDAALDVFAEEGFGRSTVEQVCERAGFTRGAFYSNFSSLDELFLALWEERSARMLDDVRTALAGVDPDDPEAAVRAAIDATPVDDAWFRITAEFTAHALRNPGLRRVMAAREEAIRDAILPVFVTALGRLGGGSRTNGPWATPWWPCTTGPPCRSCCSRTTRPYGPVARPSS